MALVERALDHKPGVSASSTANYWGTQHTEEAAEVRNRTRMSRQRCLTARPGFPWGPSFLKVNLSSNLMVILQ